MLLLLLFCQERDDYTQELTKRLSWALFKKTGRRPHVVLNNLQRSHLDANRDLAQAAFNVTFANLAWTQFHNFINRFVN